MTTQVTVTVLGLAAAALLALKISNQPQIIVRHERDTVVQTTVDQSPAVTEAARLDFLCQQDWKTAVTQKDRETAIDGYGPLMTHESGMCQMLPDGKIAWSKRK